MYIYLYIYYIVCHLLIVRSFVFVLHARSISLPVGVLRVYFYVLVVVERVLSIYCLSFPPSLTIHDSLPHPFSGCFLIRQLINVFSPPPFLLSASPLFQHTSYVRPPCSNVRHARESRLFHTRKR